MVAPAPSNPTPSPLAAPRPQDPPIASLPFADLLARLAAKTPTPGGGAAACAAGALAAAAAGMVVAYSVNKKDLAPHHATLKDAALRLERARTLFLTLADEDAAAYGLLNHLERLPDTDPTRLRDEPAAKQAATDIPLAAAAAAEELARLLDTLPTITNPHLKSDLAVAAHLALAAARAAGCNVRINLPLLEPAPRAAAEALIASLLDRAAAFATNVERACA